MKISGVGILAVVAIWTSFVSFVAAASHTPNIDALKKEVQAKGPREVRALIVRRFGPPAREVGSGLQIEQWQVDGGVLTFHPLTGPTFDKGGVRTRLIHTTNPAALCLFGNYEMVTLPEGPHGMHYWPGDVSLSPGRYVYTDSRNNLDHRDKQRSNFFMLHPSGLAQVKYAPQVTGETRLEDLPDGSPIAIVTFTTPDRRLSNVYRVSRTARRWSLSLKTKK